MRIPETKIDEIRLSANIVDVISGYVHLKKRGKNYVGLCPFHQEKTPSFSVSEEKQIYKCFGCQAGGNVFSFLMEYKNISFVEAVQEVAEQVGIKLAYEQTDPGVQSELEILYDINVFAAKYFSNNLFNSELGEIAREYFKKRHIKLQTQKTFGLGYAFSQWEHFLHLAKEEGIDLPKAKQLGLIDTRNDGSFYDKFRGRIIFPIFSPNGRVIGFGGRILNNEDKTAKYLNSPESPIYLKRRSLYGLFHSKEEIRKLDKAILVEGYMDLIALYQSGIKNVVASSGTALTEDQIKLLSRFTKNIYVIFDADEAGQSATLRSIELLLKQDFDVRLITLPEGEDPDSFINNFGKKEFEDKLKTSQNFLEYQLETYRKKGFLDDPVKQTEAIRELVKSVAIINDELKRNLMIKSIAKKFNLREKLIETELDKLIVRTAPEVNRPVINKSPDGSKIGLKDTKNKNGNGYKLEVEIIRLLFEGSEEILDNIFDNIIPEDFKNERLRNIAELVLENYRKDIISPSVLVEKIENQEDRNFILQLSLHDTAISPKHGQEIISEKVLKNNAVKYSRDVVKKFRLIRLDQQIKNNNLKINQNSSPEEIIELLKLNKELELEKKNIRESVNELNNNFEID